MDESNRNDLENALRSVVSSNSVNGSTNGLDSGGIPGDLAKLAMQYLPTLLENSEEREDLLELLKEREAGQQKELMYVRRQLHALVKSQKGLLKEFRLMRKLQLSMVEHMARIQLLEDSDNDYDDEYPSVYDDAEDESDYFDTQPEFEHTEQLSGAKRRGKPRKTRNRQW